MDFVDLDKVLDQFEEEEKAAGEIQPGQETTPSGYAEYLASHQDRPWEALSYADPSDTARLKQLHVSAHTVSYDDPYDNYGVDQHPSVSTAGQGVILSGKPGDVGGSLYAKNNINSEYYHSHNGVGYTYGGSTGSPALNEEEELQKVKLKQQMIEAFLPFQQKTNSYEHNQVIGSPEVNGSLDLHDKVKHGEEGERRGLIASQPASIQTDVLSPRSEQELWSSPYPKSDIIVVGHEDNASPLYASTAQTSEATEPKETQNSVVPTYASVPSAEPHHQDTVSQGAVERSPLHTDTGSESGTGGGAPSQANDVSMESPTSESQRTQQEGGEAVTHKNTDRSSTDSNNTAVKTSDGQCETHVKPEALSSSAVAGSLNGNGTTENSVVGFEVDECTVDHDEIEAYLQNLEGNSDSGCEDVTKEQSPLSSSLTSEEAVNTSHNKAGDDSVERVGSGEVLKSCLDVPAEEDMETESENDKQSSMTDEINPPGSGITLGDSSLAQTVTTESSVSSVGELQSGSVQSVDTDDGLQSGGKVYECDEISDNNNAMVSTNPDIVANVHVVTAASVHPQPREQMQAMDVSKGDIGPSQQQTGDIKPAYVQAGHAEPSLSSAEGEHGPSPSQTGSEVEPSNVRSGFEPKKAVAVSLEFPVTGTGSDLSALVKGRLEIESLLDEAVADKLAQKQAESNRREATPPAEQAPTVTRPMETTVVPNQPAEPVTTALPATAVGESDRDLGPGLPALGTSSSPTLGIGARPKDPSQIRKNRPNSLLGLSKINLGTPFSPPPQSTDTCLPGQQLTVEDGGRPPYSMQSLDSVNSSDSSLQPQNQFYSEARHLGAPPPGMSAPVPDSGAPAPGSAGAVQASDLEAPVTRRPEASLSEDGGEGVEASNGGQRPRSWSPSTMASPPFQRMKRPTSLNLPVRQDFGCVGNVSPDGEGPRTRKAEVMQDIGLANDTGSSEDDNVAMGEADGGSSGGTDAMEEEGAAAAAEVPFEQPPQSILHMNLGKVAPTWVPDAEAPACMECSARFTFTKRRHHCRACGKVFCSNCCSLKSRLAYQDNKEGRVCISCHQLLAAAESCSPAGNVACRSPNPNNPIEYCSTIPPPQQANARAPLPTVMVPTGVLKREGSNRKSEPKQVMFSDGIRPGGDLTELDGSDQARVPPRRSGRVQKKVERQQGDHTSPKTRRLRGGEGTRNPCLIPEEGLPPVVLHDDGKGQMTLSETSDPASLMSQIRSEEASPVVFAVNKNLSVLVKIINLDCCVNREVWCFTTRGMITVGQEELVMVLETLPQEETIPRDVFCHFSTVYEEAGKGNTVSNMGHTIFNQQFLDSRGHGGMLYLRTSFQCTLKLVLPEPPFLFAILLQKWETPWAKVFPIRLMLRLGAEYRYYPCPLVSIRNRKPVFYEIGHTIMNLLADFRNFQYMLPQIRGLTIHMEDKKTYINLPRNRYEDLMKVVSDSNEHVMAMGASFSMEADSHLVCIQNEEGTYQTQAINIQNKPRQVTGASFVVFNGALKSSSGLRAKSSIVEDGLMVQIMPEMMAALKQSMKDMVDFNIGCGSATAPEPEEIVLVRWVDDDKQVNIGVKSPVDGMAMDGVESIHVHNATDYVGDNYAIRWTEVFFLQTESGSSRWEPVDLSRVAETLASAVSIALTPHLDQLKQAGLTKIGLRVTLEPERVGYEVGSNGERLPGFYMNDLDNALIPVIHGAITQSREGPIVLELILHIIH